MTAQRVSLAAANSRGMFPNGTVVESRLGGTEANQWLPPQAETGARSVQRPSQPILPLGFDSALGEVDIREQETIELGEIAPMPFRGLSTADTITLHPAAAPDGAQVVLYVDDSGGLSWHFPDDMALQSGARAGSRSGATTTPRAERAQFTIRTRQTPERPSTGLEGTSVARGPITKLARTLFKVLVIPIASRVLGSPLNAIVGAIERRRRQELVRWVTPDDYRIHSARAVHDWRPLSEGRTLLIIHGLFSSTEGMLAQLPLQTMRDLHAAYDGRVIAFDQLTVTRTPEDNVRYFLQELRQGGANGPMEFDILAHSRGGIVARLLAEQGRALDPAANCAFRKVYFVATPNAGSPLADATHVVDMIDVFTNFLTNFPDGAAMYSLEILLAIVKLLAATSERELPGIAAMSRTGFIQSLNARQPVASAEYAAAAADYDPDEQRDNAFFTSRFANTIVDQVFARKANDLVVPRDGVFAANGSAAFPITRTLIFPPTDHIWHSGFFADPRTLAHMSAFLTADTPVAVAEKLTQRIARVDPVNSLQTD